MGGILNESAAFVRCVFHRWCGFVALHEWIRSASDAYTLHGRTGNENAFSSLVLASVLTTLAGRVEAQRINARAGHCHNDQLLAVTIIAATDRR